MSQEQTKQYAYVERVLELYQQAPETPAHSNRLDRRLAVEFYEQQVKIEEVEAAILLATARRLLRNPQAPKLGPIRSLHYFVPVIEEIKSTTVSQSYLEYLRRKLVASASLFDRRRNLYSQIKTISCFLLLSHSDQIGHIAEKVIKERRPDTGRGFLDYGNFSIHFFRFIICNEVPAM